MFAAYAAPRTDTASSVRPHYQLPDQYRDLYTTQTSQARHYAPDNARESSSTIRHQAPDTSRSSSTRHYGQGDSRSSQTRSYGSSEDVFANSRTSQTRSYGGAGAYTGSTSDRTSSSSKMTPRYSTGGTATSTLRPTYYPPTHDAYDDPYGSRPRSRRQEYVDSMSSTTSAQRYRQELSYSDAQNQVETLERRLATAMNNGSRVLVEEVYSDAHVLSKRLPNVQGQNRMAQVNGRNKVNDLEDQLDKVMQSCRRYGVRTAY